MRIKSVAVRTGNGCTAVHFCTAGCGCIPAVKVVVVSCSCREITIYLTIGDIFSNALHITAAGIKRQGNGCLHSSELLLGNFNDISFGDIQHFRVFRTAADLIVAFDLQCARNLTVCLCKTYIPAEDRILSQRAEIDGFKEIQRSLRRRQDQSKPGTALYLYFAENHGFRIKLQGGICII